ncbi:hypothetical protein [Proteiniclasticum sp.]|uniref:hypothetical protein n=1 Tax=Proteiniclasticum sp. TaxID=2053595 RepID=UPI0028964DE0|nr:hypothetical protein [Proteiniclasticum sp.]
MKIMRKISMITIIAGLTVAISGCSYFGLTPDISEYVDPAQDSVQDNEELASYIEEVKPVLEAYYTDGRTLSSIGVKGNEVNVEIDLGDSSDPYDDFEKLMVYETTRVTHSILNYRDNPSISEIYRINLNFTGRKTVTLYGAQAVESEGTRDFDAQTILDAVKRK